MNDGKLIPSKSKRTYSMMTFVYDTIIRFENKLLYIFLPFSIRYYVYSILRS